jgi:hypothetical protein
VTPLRKISTLYNVERRGPQSNLRRPGRDGKCIPSVKFFLLIKNLEIMVTIVGLEKRTNKAKKEDFNVLVLQGAIEVVVSKTTGRPYITARKTSIPCTFDEKLAQNLIGSALPGTIERKECDPYEFIIPNTKKKITLTHTFQYSPTPATVEEVVG